MQVKLPHTGCTVILRSYVSQDLHEKLQLLSSNLLGMDTGEAIRLRMLNVEQIGEELGMDRMMEIQNCEEDEQREVLLNEARAEVIGKRLNLNTSVDGAQKLSRARTAGMIESVTLDDGKEIRDRDEEAWSKWLGTLHNRDYELLDHEAEKIVDASQEEMGKPSALPDASSPDSQVAAQETTREPDSK